MVSVGPSERLRAGDHPEVAAGKPEARDAAAAALQAGVQHVDQAAMYGDAHRERTARGDDLLQPEVVTAHAKERYGVTAGVDRRRPWQDDALAVIWALPTGNG